jgi:hypothetical protein
MRIIHSFFRPKTAAVNKFRLLSFGKISFDRKFLKAHDFWQVKNLSRILSILGFSILSGLFGLGVTWLVVAILFVRNNDERLTKIMPLLLAGGIIGLVIGIFAGLRVAKTDPRTEKTIEDKYVGFWGRVKIYLGAPIFIMVATGMLTPVEKLLTHALGDNVATYVMLGIVLMVIAVSLFLYDYTPKKLVVPIGVIGWLLTLALIIWFFFFGPGVFGHSSL